jgi:hypothetical protein
MVKGMIDGCFVAGGNNASSNLMDILYVMEDNQKVYMRKKIVDTVKEPITEKFANLTSQSGSTLPTLAEEPALLQLRQQFATTPVEGSILPCNSASNCPADMTSDAQYQALAQDSELAEAFLTTAAACEDKNGTLGINTFVTKLEAYQNTNSVGSIVSNCADRAVTCKASDAAEGICAAGNNYLKLKNLLLSSNKFKCDLFEDPNNPSLYCDPAISAYPCGKVTNGVWTTKRKSKTCSFTEFVQYWQAWDLRIGNVMEHIDIKVPEVFDDINTKLREVTDDQIIAPIDTIVNGSICTFIGQTFQETIDGMCFQTVRGLYDVGRSYIGCGACGAFLTMIMYGVWRRTLDNSDNWEAECIAKE